MESPMWQQAKKLRSFAKNKHVGQGRVEGEVKSLPYCDRRLPGCSA